MEVVVLRTHFNINAYKDEPTINTTLLEERVKVRKGTSLTIIEPGQQTRLNESRVQIQLVLAQKQSSKLSTKRVTDS